MIDKHPIENTYKIALIGTEFTGKSEFAPIIKRYLTRECGLSTYIIEEIVHSSPYLQQLKSTPESQQWILDMQEEMILAVAPLYDVLLLDRTILDNACYWEYTSRNEQSEKDIETHMKEWAFEKTRKYSDLILHFSSFPAKEDDMSDGWRQGDPKWRHDMDMLIRERLGQFRLYLKEFEQSELEKGTDPDQIHMPGVIMLESNSALYGKLAQGGVYDKAIQIIERKVVPEFKSGRRKSATFKNIL